MWRNHLTCSFCSTDSYHGNHEGHGNGKRSRDCANGRKGSKIWNSTPSITSGSLLHSNKHAYHLYLSCNFFNVTALCFNYHEILKIVEDLYLIIVILY